MTDPQPTKPVTGEGGAQSPPEFDRVAERLATIQQQVSAQAGEASAEVERRVQAAAVEQRGRVADLRKELTDRVTELAGRFDTLLSVLDDVDRELAATAGDVRVTVTEQAPAQVPQKAGEPSAPPAKQAPATAPPAAAGAPAQQQDEKKSEEKLSEKSPILRFLRRGRRSKGSS
jgi:hypothetical protein